MARIEIDRRRPSRRCTVLVDGVPALTTSSEVLRLLEIVECDNDPSADPTAMLAAVAEAESAAARERSYRLLGYRERSHHELKDRLRQDGYSASTIDSTLERLDELGLIDDERFAGSFARTRAAAGWGSMRIRVALQGHHIAEDTINTVLAESCTESDELDRASRIIGHAPVDDARSRSRAYAKLLRRGFSSSIARRALADSQQGGD